MRLQGQELGDIAAERATSDRMESRPSRLATAVAPFVAPRAAPVTIFVVALLVRMATAWPLRQPGYMDAYYYYHVADSLFHGKGFVEEFAWNWLSLPDRLPQPSNVYWMPLISILDYLAFVVFGESFRAAQVPSILLSSLFPVLAYWVGRDIFHRPRYAWAMAFLTTFSGVGILYWVIPDNFGPFAVLGFLSLVLTYRGLRDSPWYHLPVGIMAGLAYLSRPDGALFLVTQIGCVVLFDARNLSPHPGGGQAPALRRAMHVGLERVGQSLGPRASCPPPGPLAGEDACAPRKRAGEDARAPRGTRPDGRGQAPALRVRVLLGALGRIRPLRRQADSAGDRQGRPILSGQMLFVAGSVVLFLLTLAPWLLRNQAAFGALLPPGGTKALFLTDYNDMFAYGKDLSPKQYLDWGLGNILGSKLGASAENALLVGELMLFYMLPFALVGFWSLRRRVEYLPFLVHGALLYGLMSWVFTFPGPRGSFLHSSVALLPFVYGATLVGLDRAVVSAASRLRHWQIGTAQRNFTVLMVLFAFVASVGLAVRGTVSWDERYAKYQELAQWLGPRTGADELVMLVDPPGYYYSSGRRSIVATNDDLETTLKVARKYNVRYVVLEPAHPLPWHQWYLGKESPAELIPRDSFNEMRVYEVSPPR